MLRQFWVPTDAERGGRFQTEGRYYGTGSATRVTSCVNPGWWDTSFSRVGHSSRGWQEAGRDDVGIDATRAPPACKDAGLGQLRQMARHRAPGLPRCGSERADGGEAPPGAVGERHEVLQRPVQMPADGAVQVEGDGDERKHGTSECCSTRPEAPCPGHTSPVARIGACVKRRFREISSCHELDSPVRRYCRPALRGGFCYFGFWVLRPRVTGAVCADHPRTA